MNQLVHPASHALRAPVAAVAPAQERFNDRNPKGGNSGRRLTPTN
jgi:hypothetical protein